MPNNKGGKIKRSGYWYIKSLNHPLGGKQKYVAEHRLVMEKHLGRYLKKKEVVHHIDHNITNNDITNLELCESAGQHVSKYHPEARENARIANLGRRPSNYNRGNKTCPICKTSFETIMSKVSGKIFCSRSCYYKNRKGKRVSVKTEFQKGQRPWNFGK